MTGFIITEDHIDAGRKGFRMGDFLGDKLKVEFRLYDDNAELYFVGQATGELGAEMAHNWASEDTGVTYSEIRPIGSGEWKSFIG